MSVLGPIMSISPYLRSVMVWFPLNSQHRLCSVCCLPVSCVLCQQLGISLLCESSLEYTIVMQIEALCTVQYSSLEYRIVMQIETLGTVQYSSLVYRIVMQIEALCTLSNIGTVVTADLV